MLGISIGETLLLTAMRENEQKLAKARIMYPTVEQFRINGDEVEGYFDNSCGEFISSVHDDEMIPTGIWMSLTIY